MDFPDLTNGLFELLGAAAIMGHVVRVFKDKKVAGVSIWSTVFFAAWGFWNLYYYYYYYYPHLGQWASFAGGIAIVLGNCLWIAGLFYYSRHPGGRALEAEDLGCSPPPRCDDCGRRQVDAIALADRNIALRQLVAKKTQYVSLLEAELVETIGHAVTFGWRSTRAKEGETIREKIAVAEAALGISD